MDEREVLELIAQLDAEYQRERAQLDAEYKEASKGLKILLAMRRRRRNGSAPSPSTEPVPTPEAQPRPNPDSNTERPKRARGILSATRAILDQLPDPFNTAQLKDRLEESPEFAGKIKTDSLRGTLKTLSDEGWIQQIAEGSGPRPALYKRLKLTVEKPM